MVGGEETEIATDSAAFAENEWGLVGVVYEEGDGGEWVQGCEFGCLR